MEDKRKRGRPRKAPIEENEAILSEKSAPLQMTQRAQPVTMDDVRNSLTSLFEQSMSGGVYDALTNLNQYNPFLQNTRLKMISSYPMNYSPEEINTFLKEPQHHEYGLRSAAQGLSASQYLYYRILREAADIPLFKYYVTPPTLSKDEYLSQPFLKEEEFVDNWLRVLDIPNTLKRVALETKREGKSTYVFRQCIEEEKGKKKARYVTWQKLPSDFTKLTAIGEHGYIASFNLLVFLNPAFSPMQYPEYIREIWNDLINNKVIQYDITGKKYNLDFNKLRKYTYQEGVNTVKGTLEMAKNSYMYWVQLPQDLCFTFASDSSNAWAAPDTMGLFTALQELTDYSTLAGLVASTPLTAILTGQAEGVPNAQPGQDQTMLSPHTMIAFQNTFNSMASSNIQAFLAPFKDLKLQSLPNIPNASDIKTKAVQNFISTAGEGGLITATDKPSVAMVKGAQLMSASQYDFVTRQFETVINMLLHRWTGVKYEWKVNLWGDVFSFDSTVKIMKEMVAGGATFLLPKLASAHNLTMRNIRGINNYMEAHKIYDGFKTLGWAQTQARQSDSGLATEETKSVGRPPMDEDEIENDNTAASKDAGNNITELKDFIANNICFVCGAQTEDGHALCEECEAEYEIGGENNE